MSGAGRVIVPAKSRTKEKGKISQEIQYVLDDRRLQAKALELGYVRYSAGPDALSGDASSVASSLRPSPLYRTAYPIAQVHRE